MANGEIFNFFCSDDTLDRTDVEIAIKTFRENPDAKMVFSDQRIIDEMDNILDIKKMKDFNLNTLLNVNPDLVSQPTTFIKKSVFNEVGLWDEKLHYANDLDLFIRILQKFDGVYIPMSIGNGRRHPEEKEIKGFNKGILENYRIIRKYGGKVLSKAVLHMIKSELRWVLGLR